LTTPAISSTPFATCDEALDALAARARDVPVVAGEVFMVAQDHKGNCVGETIYASSVRG